MALPLSMLTPVPQMRTHTTVLTLVCPSADEACQSDAFPTRATTSSTEQLDPPSTLASALAFADAVARSRAEVSPTELPAAAWATGLKGC